MENNEIQVFEFQTNQVRIVMINDEPWFVAKDVAEILGIGRTSDIVQRLDEGEKGTDLIRTLGGFQKMTIINESGLYKAILRSSKPEAKIFQKWVTAEVLPTIRKTGGYVQKDRAIDFVNAWLPQVDQISRSAIASVLEINRELVIQNKEMEPKASFYDMVTQTDEWLDFATAAKLINKPGYGRNKLFAILRDKGFLQLDNQPYQEYVDRGYFKLVEIPYTREKDDVVRIRIKTVISQIGIDYISRFLNNMAT